MEEIRSLKGIHFDPKLTDALLDMAKEVKAVRDMN